MKNRFLGAIPLSDALKKYRIGDLATELGINHSAIIQMVKNDREIYIKKIDGRLHYAEFKNWKHAHKEAPPAVNE